MTKDVLISIKGMHTDAMEQGDFEDEPIEVITPASYFNKNGKHYVIYDEVAEGIPGVTKNKVKIIGNDTLEIRKNGISNTHMIFENGKKHLTYYETPFGRLLMGIHTTDFEMKESEDEIELRIAYELDVDGQPAAKCRIEMSVKSKISGIKV